MEAKLDRASDQLDILIDQMEQLQIRIDRAERQGNMPALFNLTLRFQTTKAAFDMFHMYCANKSAQIQDILNEEDL